MAMQERIVRTLVERMRLAPPGGESARVAKRYTADPAAYELYLKGRYYWNKRSDDAVRQSIVYFRQALDRDPNYAPAWVGLGDAYAMQGIYGTLPPKETMPKAKAAIMHALAIDDSLAEAHTALAGVYDGFEWDWPAAEREYQRAIELNPSYATAHQWYAIYLTSLGRLPEALQQIELAKTLDPLSLSVNSTAGWILYFAGKHEQAVQQLRKTLDMDSSFYRARWRLGIAYEAEGKYDRAIAELSKVTPEMDTHALALLAYTQGVAGNTAEAKRLLERLLAVSRRRYVSPYSIAAVYVALGERDEAMRWLERAYENRDDWLAYVKVDPILAPLRASPRFRRLVVRVGLAP
jgi:tetratricopeptide (TPR) repeat protein